MPPNGTRLFAVVGDPVAHSLSPAMHNAAIAALGLDAKYVALRTTTDAFPEVVRELLEQGGGCSVTRPFKDIAFGLGGEHTDAATRTRAVNCISGPPDRPVLDNTDVTGVRGALDELLGSAPIRTAVLYGTGGAARAAAIALGERDPAALVLIVSRDPGRAETFAQWAAEHGVRCEAGLPDDGSDAVGINATPDASAVRRPPCTLLDLNYARGGTALVQRQRAGGARAMDGRAMLVHQGAAAFTRFFGVQPPIEVMRRAVEDALRP